MIARFLGLDQVGPITYFEWFLRHPWPGWAVCLLIAAAVAFVVYLYQRERMITSGRRLFLSIFRAAVFAIVILLLFEPSFAIEMEVKVRQSILIMLDASQSMGIRDPRKNREHLEDAALAIGEASYAKVQVALPDRFAEKVKQLTRMDLARSILSNSELKLSEKLSENYQLRYFLFGDTLIPVPGYGKEIERAMSRAETAMKSTAIGTSIEDVVSHYGGQAISGVIFLTDGASNQGRDPLEVARRMKDAGIPLYPIGVGLPSPPDLQVRNLIAQEVAFKGDEVRIRVQVLGVGYENREVEVVLKLGEEDMGRESLLLTGREQFVEIPFVPEEAGTFRIDVSVNPFPDETLNRNNSVSQTLKVIDDTIKVLYIEGNPRWEYRYLRQVLLRDHRLDVKFIMTEGDPDLAKYDNRYLNRFPLEKREAFHFDLVILGDVRHTFFKPEELELMEELVRERGGSFLLLAGQEHAPKEYFNTPVEKLLPVELLEGGGETVDDLVTPILTQFGRKGSFVRIGMDDSENDRLWSMVKPLYRVPRLEGLKPGATSLAELSTSSRRSEAYPLISWHRYGTGKVLYVGTDQLWRLRFKRGDKYHARLWGQAIQFLTLSRLLGENKQISLQTDRKEYWTGEPVRIYANVLNESFETVEKEQYDVFIEKLGAAKGKEKLELLPVPDTPGLYQGYHTPDRDGRYQLTVDPEDQEKSNIVEFDILTKPLEQIDSAMHEDLLRKMAELSGGKYFSIRELPKLPEALGGKTRTVIVRREKELWDLPAVFIIILTFVGLEWFLRRRFNLL